MLRTVPKVILVGKGKLTEYYYLIFTALTYYSSFNDTFDFFHPIKYHCKNTK